MLLNVASPDPVERRAVVVNGVVDCRQVIDIAVRPSYQPIAASCFSSAHLSQIYGRLALLTASFLQENSTRLSPSLSMAGKRFSSFRRRSPVDRCAFPQSLLSLLNSHLPVSLSLKYVPFLVPLYLVRKAHTPLIVLYVKYAHRQPSQVSRFL